MDHEAWLQRGLSGADEDMKEAYRYFMRPDPDMRDFVGPIEEGEDALTGRVMRSRLSRVGMLRNADDSEKREVRVYLDPLPHIRLDKAKPLQGWYQSKFNEKGNSRDRPCFTDAVLTEPYGGYCTVGCSFSLPAGELISTPRGLKPIERFRKGDFVWGRSHLGTVLAQVLGTTKHWKAEGYVALHLKDGRRLRLTADHPVYSSD